MGILEIVLAALVAIPSVVKLITSIRSDLATKQLTDEERLAIVLEKAVATAEQGKLNKGWSNDTARDHVASVLTSTFPNISREDVLHAVEAGVNLAKLATKG